MRFTGEILALLTTISWSISPYIFTKARHRIGTIQLNVDRLLLATVILGAFLLLANIPLVITWKQTAYMVLSGITGLMFGDYCLFRAYGEIGPRHTMLVMSLSPAITSILAWIIYGETLPLISIIGIGITISGILLVVMDGNHSNEQRVEIKRLKFAFLAAVGQAGGIVLSKMAYLDGELNGVLAAFIRMPVAGISFGIAMYILRRYRNPIKLYRRDRKSFQLLTLGAVFGPCIGMTLSVVSIMYIPVGLASTIFATSPVIMLFISHFLYRDKFSFKTILGVIITVLGVSCLFLCR